MTPLVTPVDGMAHVLPVENDGMCTRYPRLPSTFPAEIKDASAFWSSRVNRRHHRIALEVSHAHPTWGLKIIPISRGGNAWHGAGKFHFRNRERKAHPVAPVHNEALSPVAGSRISRPATSPWINHKETPTSRASRI
jgi:hypothetical protein